MVMTRMNRGRARIGYCLAIAGVATIAAACGSSNSTPTGQAHPAPEVLDCSFDKPSTRPDHLILACADLGVQVDKITWKSWAADKAEGDGTERDNTCTPNCAAGHYTTKSVHVVLSDPVQPANLYTKALTVGPDGKTSHFPLVEQR